MNQACSPLWLLVILLTSVEIQISTSKEVSKWCMTQKRSSYMVIIFISPHFLSLSLSLQDLCYALSFLDTSWTDSRPYFTVNMTFSNLGFIQSRTWIQKDIAYPVSKIRVSQKTGSKFLPPFNMTARLCDLYNALSRIPTIKKAFLSATKNSNLTLACPLKAGFYIMDNIRFDKNSRVLALMHRPKDSFLFEGGMYEELRNKKLQTLTTYRFTVKVIKTSCKD